MSHASHIVSANITAKLRHNSRKLIRELGILQPDANPHETPQHWHSIIEIGNKPGITFSELGEILLLSKSSVSRIISNLHENKLVSFTKTLDKREKALQLTKLGKNKLAEIDIFSNNKIAAAFKFLSKDDQKQISLAIEKYASALEKSRIEANGKISEIKILTLPNSRLIRKNVAKMIGNIQKHEFHLPVTNAVNTCVLTPEKDFHYNNSCNFWYAIDETGEIAGSIGLKKIDAQNGEIKKFFVAKKYRGQGLSKMLWSKILQSAREHGFKHLYLGTVSKLKAAQTFYLKQNFKKISPKDLPKKYEKCNVDDVFFSGKVIEE